VCLSKPTTAQVAQAPVSMTTFVWARRSVQLGQTQLKHWLRNHVRSGTATLCSGHGVGMCAAGAGSPSCQGTRPSSCTGSSTSAACGDRGTCNASSGCQAGNPLLPGPRHAGQHQCLPWRGRARPAAARVQYDRHAARAALRRYHQVSIECCPSQASLPLCVALSACAGADGGHLSGYAALPSCVACCAGLWPPSSKHQCRCSRSSWTTACGSNPR
jgi:hypothetical protein